VKRGVGGFFHNVELEVANTKGGGGWLGELISWGWGIRGKIKRKKIACAGGLLGCKKKENDAWGQIKKEKQHWGGGKNCKRKAKRSDAQVLFLPGGEGLRGFWGAKKKKEIGVDLTMGENLTNKKGRKLSR